MEKPVKLNRERSTMGEEPWIARLAESDERLHISLTNDFAFKRTFHNRKALTGLLSALLKIPACEIQRIDFQDSHLPGEYAEDKEGILDLRLYIDGGRRINNEMQVKYFPYWEERSLYYLSRMYLDNFGKGDSYDKLEECIHISILKFDLYPNPPLYSSVELWDMKNQHRYSDKLSLRVLELSQIDQAIEEKNTDIYLWARMISTSDWEVLEMLAKKIEYLKEAKDEMEKINSDKGMRYEYLRQEMKASDEATILEYYTKKGERKGERKGEERFGELSLRLLGDDRTEDLQRAATDREYRRRLFEEYGIPD